LRKKIKKEEENFVDYSLILGTPDRKLRKPTKEDFIVIGILESFEGIIENLQKEYKLSPGNANKLFATAIKNFKGD
jgi:hypothetical protein